MIFAILSRFLFKTINNNKVFIFFIFAPALVAVFPFKPLFLYNLLCFLFFFARSCSLPVVSKCKTCFKEMDFGIYICTTTTTPQPLRQSDYLR